MSKEASSWAGTILGSSDYWEKLNRDTLFSDVTTRRPDLDTGQAMPSMPYTTI